MQCEPKLGSLNLSDQPQAAAHRKVPVRASFKRSDHDYAKAEIDRLKRELAQTREEFAALTEATCAFMRQIP